MRWAMLITVDFANSVRIVLWMIASVCVSTDAVASSSTKILAFFKSARPRQNNCLWPTLQFSPFSTTTTFNQQSINKVSSNWTCTWLTHEKKMKNENVKRRETNTYAQQKMKDRYCFKSTWALCSMGFTDRKCTKWKLIDRSLRLLDPQMHIHLINSCTL